MSLTRGIVVGLAALDLIAGLTVGADGAAAQRRGTRPITRTVGDSAAQPRWKGIWEPVNYGEDVDLSSAYFVTADEGWVGGGSASGHGVLLHTTDGGAHWDVALGDPAGSQPRFTDLQFVDQQTGFAVQPAHVGDHTLLRTTDGAHWQASGTVPQHRLDYRFISPTVGVASVRNEIDRTTDGGRTWTKVGDCLLKVQVRGLPRQVRCEAAAFAFPSAAVGYALGNSFDARGLYILKTTDGGATWGVALVVPDVDGREGHLFFNDEQTGYICTADGRLFGTTDGAATWNGLPGAQCESKSQILFADHDVGWTLRSHRLTYTADGGQRWVSRDVNFPAGVNAFSLPRRDRAYAVGPHGMIYRYRVVPETTVVDAAAIAAPAMPGLPTVLATDVGQLQQQVAGVDSGFSAFVDPGTGAAAGTVASGSAAGQDPVSPFMQRCCGKRLASLTPILTAVGAIAPEFTSRYRNLNLLTQGLRTASALPDAASTLRSAVHALRTSTDKASAMSALTQVKSVLATLRATTDTALQHPAFMQ